MSLHSIGIQEDVLQKRILGGMERNQDYHDRIPHTKLKNWKTNSNKLRVTTKNIKKHIGHFFDIKQYRFH